MSLIHLDSQLESILEEVEKIKSVTASKRKRHKVAAFFLSQSHTSVLKKCSEDLEWAMAEFDVSSKIRHLLTRSSTSRIFDRYLLASLTLPGYARCLRRFPKSRRRSPRSSRKPRSLSPINSYNHFLAQSTLASTASDQTNHPAASKGPELTSSKRSSSGSSTQTSHFRASFG